MSEFSGTDLRAEIETILDTLDLLGASYGERGEYAFEAQAVAAGFEQSVTVDDLEALVRASFSEVAAYVRDDRLYRAAAERLALLRR